jgi:hypothetical protein
MLEKVTTQTSVNVGDLVAMGPKIIVRSWIETALASSFSSLLLDNSFEFPQLV